MPNELAPDETAAVGYPIAGVQLKMGASREVILSGQSLMRGYLDYLELGNPAITEFATGDIGLQRAVPHQRMRRNVTHGWGH